MSQNGDQIGIANAFARGIPPMTVSWTGLSESYTAVIFGRFTKGFDRDVTDIFDSIGNWQREKHRNDRIEVTLECKITGSTQALARTAAADAPIKGQTIAISGATNTQLNHGNWIVRERPDVSFTPEGETIMVLQIHCRLLNGVVQAVSDLGENRVGFNAGPTLIHDEVSENTRTGSDFIQVYRGTLTEMRNARTDANAAGASATVIRPIGDGEYEMTAAYPFDENGIEAVDLPSIHELEVDVAQVAWTSNIKLLGLLGSVSKVQQLRRIIDDYLAGKYDTTEAGHTPEGDAEVDADNVDGTWGIEVFRIVGGFGADAFIQYSSVYRRTLTAATAPQVAASRTGECKIFTTTEMIAQEGLDNAFFNFDLNSQWLKSRPQVLAVANQKTQVVYSYTECYKAARIFYDAFGTAVLFSA